MGGNYRSISLSSLVAKTYNRMIMNRIRPYLDFHLGKNQNGFRSGRTTTRQILALRRLIEGLRKIISNLYVSSLSLRKLSIQFIEKNAANTKSV